MGIQFANCQKVRSFNPDLQFLAAYGVYACRKLTACMQSHVTGQVGIYLCFHLFCQKRIVNHWGLTHLKNPYL